MPSHMSTSLLYAAPPGHLTLLMAARRTASFICPQDPRSSFYLYVPRAHPVTRRAKGEDVGPDDWQPDLISASSHSRSRSPEGFPLLVVIHDSSRDAEKLRDRWADFAEEEGCVVLSPHFPCDLAFPDGPDNYKRLVWQTEDGKIIRYDQVLLSMIDTVKEQWGCVETSTFSLVGFSGGGQFVSRFFYLYPHRVHAVSIGAPGRATPLRDLPWPQGIRDAPTASGSPIDVQLLAERTRTGATAVQLLIGSEDTWHPVQPDGSRAAQSRFDVAMDVAASFDEAGVQYDFVIVPGAKHEGEKIRAEALPWIKKHFRARDTVKVQQTKAHNA